jgi:hypothetical protein
MSVELQETGVEVQVNRAEHWVSWTVTLKLAGQIYAVCARRSGRAVIGAT